MTPPLRITLVGFSGAGKSTVARLVAERLGWSWVDTDDLIERQAAKTVPELFATEGEAAFREREAMVFASLKADRLVVAAGGGSGLPEGTRRSIVEAGLVICLDATVETVVARLAAAGDGSVLRSPLSESKGLSKGPERPLLAGEDPLGRVRRLKAQRAAVYALADATISTDWLSPDEVADEVVRFYRQHGERAFNRPGRVESLTATPPWLPPIIDAPGAASIVRAASAEYPVYVGWGILDRLGDCVRRATGSRRAFVVSDASVLRLWGEAALSSLRAAGIAATSFALPPGDGSKSLEAAGQVYGWLASEKAERRDAIVALGGGMIGDLAGFVAGTYLRGMPLVQAPTSLLAMVDASIGGKTAVNHAGAKNLVGLFYQPRAVVADVSTLSTLPRRELVEGLGEVIKHAFILAPDLLELLEARLDDLLALEPELATAVIRRNVQVKAAVVSEDERETGGRREVLNYGHTLGHAFEAAGGYQALLHGEAVGVGMIAAAEIGRRLGVTPEAVARRQRDLLARAGLPLKPPPGLDRGKVDVALALDKKVQAGKQRWVLLQDVGRTVIRDDVPAELVSEVVGDLLGA